MKENIVTFVIGFFLAAMLLVSVAGAVLAVLAFFTMLTTSIDAALLLTAIAFVGIAGGVAAVKSKSSP